MRTRFLGLLLVASGLLLALPPVPAPTDPPMIGASVGGRTGPDGTVLDCDLPGSQHMRNKGGNDRWRGNPLGVPGKGSGLCVFTSGQMGARLANLKEMEGFQEWMTRKPGGGTPEKLDAMISQFCKEKGVAVPPYVQFRPGSVTPDICRGVLASGRMLCHTYQVSPSYPKRYGDVKGGWIEHMVCTAAGSKGMFAVLDNNYPGEDSYEWSKPGEWWSAVTGGGKRRPWAWCWLAPPPPPPPRNR